MHECPRLFQPSSTPARSAIATCTVFSKARVATRPATTGTAPAQAALPVVGDPIGAIQDNLSALEDETANVLREDEVVANRQRHAGSVNVEESRFGAGGEYRAFSREEVDFAVGAVQTAVSSKQRGAIVVPVAIAFDHTGGDVALVATGNLPPAHPLSGRG